MLRATLVPGVDLDDGVLQLQTRKLAPQGAAAIDGQFQETIGHVSVREHVLRFDPFRPRRLVKQRQRVGAFGVELGVDGGVVFYLDHKLVHPPWTRSGAAGPRNTLTRASGLMDTMARQYGSNRVWISRTTESEGD